MLFQQGDFLADLMKDGQIDVGGHTFSAEDQVGEIGLGERLVVGSLRPSQCGTVLDGLTGPGSRRLGHRGGVPCRLSLRERGRRSLCGLLAAG